MVKYFISFLLFFSVSIQAEVVVNKSSRTVEGVGTGQSRTEAINNAIIEALGQLNGTYISKRTFISDTSIESSKGDSSTFIYNNNINRVTKGKVDSYSILEISEVEGEYEARVSITKTKVTKKYKTPGYNPKNRRTIAIIPSYTNKSNYSILGQIKNAKGASQRITQELVSSITKTRKFTVLDREANEAYRNEKSILMSRDASKNELLKLGQVLGADYLLVSNLTELSVSKDNTTAAIAANMSDSYKAKATVQYRIITMATRQIKWSNTMSMQFEPNGNSYEQVYLNTLKKVSENITTELMENIYPIKIVDTSSGQITINQGSLEVGQEFDVYKLGKKIYDSYTKESLGRAEKKTGKIKIVRSIAKMSVAEVIEGKVSKGDICRTSKTSNSSDYFNNPTEADYGGVTIKEGGGTVLPFD